MGEEDGYYNNNQTKKEEKYEDKVFEITLQSRKRIIMKVHIMQLNYFVFLCVTCSFTNDFKEGIWSKLPYCKVCLWTLVPCDEFGICKMGLKWN